MSDFARSLADLRTSWQNAEGELQLAVEKFQAVSSKVHSFLDDFESTPKALEAQRRQLEKDQADVLQKAEQIKRLGEDLKNEKAKMMKLDVGKSDIISLNLGGERVVTVKRSLLLQFEGSMLASMFSGRYEDQLDRDKDGNVFLDYSASVMVPLIEYLRMRRDSSPEETLSLPDIADDNKPAWQGMLRFFGLAESLCVEPATIFHGIQLGLEIRTLSGWTMFFCKSYAHPTTMSDLIPPMDLKGNGLIVGARKTGSDTLAIAAMGRIDIIMAESEDDAMHFHNGACWYACAGKAIGFAPAAPVNLCDADIADMADSMRLSWHLTGRGGWRAGSAVNLDDDTEWEKVIFIGHAQFED